ncbi:MAG: DUF6036 family nucleotidyltransferase [bacterium]|nr:DUF6036 family nucleotidyltransferase [bacterium]
MEEFYHNLITEKSFQTLQDIRKKLDFILIGGWAVFLYTKSLKSKDIDIIVDFNVLEKIRLKFDLKKNERLKKYEIKIENTDIDIYVPFFSELGLPVEAIKSSVVSLEGFNVPSIEALLLLKLFAYSERKGTLKGKKDIIDIFSLLQTRSINWQEYKGIVKKYNFKAQSKELESILNTQRQVKELGLLSHKFSQLKKEVSEGLSTGSLDK